MAETFISKRAYQIYSKDDLLEERVQKYQENAFHSTKNRDGIVNFGTALNHLMEEEWEARLNREDMLNFSASRHQHYYNLSGMNPTAALQEAAANFFNRHFESEPAVQASELTVAAGTSSCLNALAHTLFDKDDCFLTPAPFYNRTHTDMNEKNDCHAIPFNLHDQPDDNGQTFALCPARLDARISELISGGTPLKGFLLINPHNPLGDVHSAKLLRRILEVCAKYKLHVIVNEVYAFSVFDPDESFTSVLSLKDLPDPDRTHCVWAFSKDFGLAGIRCGFIHSRNSFVCEALDRIYPYYCVSSLILDMCASILNDAKWLDEFFIPLNKKRLYVQYNFAVARLNQAGVCIRPAKAGVFLWVNLRPYISDNTKEAEMALFEELFDAGVSLTPGSLFYCSYPGWFRIIYSVPKEVLETGLARLTSFLKKKKMSLGS